MVAEDFEYDGEYLKDWGCMICCSDSPSGFDTIDSDSQRSFNTVSQFNGKEAKVTTSTYEDHIELNFQICKFSCKDGVTPFHNDETREMKRWLNRPTIHKFKLIQPGWHDIYMEGSFNVSNVELNGLTYGKTIVRLTEAYPVAGRIWTTVYNTDFSSWSSWKNKNR